MNKYQIEVLDTFDHIVRIRQAGSNLRQAESYARYISRTVGMINVVRVVQKDDPTSVPQVCPDIRRHRDKTTSPFGVTRFKIEKVYNMRRGVVRRFSRYAAPA